MAVKSSLGDLHMMLMEQMERLNDADEDELKDELRRSEAMADLGKTIVSNASVMMRAARIGSTTEVPKMLTSGKDE